MNPRDIPSALDALAPWLEQADGVILTAMAIFMRISAVAFLLPAFGEHFLPVRIKLVAALTFAAITWPLVLPDAPRLSMDAGGLAVAFAAEAMSGLLIGLSVRLMVFALQIAGTLAAQSLSISQIFGAGVAPDPEPTIAAFLTFGGIALAMSLGLHVKAAALILESYRTLPFGVFPLAADAGAWTSERAARTFSLGVSLALPFIMVAFVYNLALGFINRAMPQLMVAFVGMPFITGMGLMLLSLTAGAALTLWHGSLDEALYAPLGMRP